MSSSPASAAELEPEADDVGSAVETAVMGKEFVVAGERYICTLQNLFKASSCEYYEVIFDGRDRANPRNF